MEIETVKFIVKHPHDKHKDRDKDKDEDKHGSPDDNKDNDKCKDNYGVQDLLMKIETVYIIVKHP